MNNKLLICLLIEEETQLETNCGKRPGAQGIDWPINCDDRYDRLRAQEPRR